MIEDIRKICGHNVKNGKLCFHPINRQNVRNIKECSKDACPFLNYFDLICYEDDPVIMYNNEKSEDYLLIYFEELKRKLKKVKMYYENM
jgi:hypothetical protein